MVRRGGGVEGDGAIGVVAARSGMDAEIGCRALQVRKGEFAFRRHADAARCDGIAAQEIAHGGAFPARRADAELARKAPAALRSGH